MWNKANNWRKNVPLVKKNSNTQNLIAVCTGFSLNIVFSKILKYIPDSGLSQFPLGVSVCTQMAGQTPALQQQNLQSSEKSQHFMEKHNI